MEKLVILLLSLLSSVWTLQYPVEYQYKYEGQLASGFPSIRAQAAAVGIRARLHLQMKEKTQAIAKLSEVEVGEFNDDLDCPQLRQPISFQWLPMPDPYKETLEKPFAVYFQEESEQVMKVPEEDVEFITNIRKSIVEILRLEPIIANLGGIKGDTLSKYVSGGHAPDAFSLEEESILGRCESRYTITRLPFQEARKEKERVGLHVQNDIQSRDAPRGRASNIPKLQDQYWHLVRAINFDKCSDRVIQQHAGGANMSDLGESQFRSVQSRSSVGTYLLKGEPGAFRVERAVVEGDVIANPFGFKSQRLQTVINQTLTLEKTQTIQAALRLPSVRDVKTWEFSIASPFAAPEGRPKQWINYRDQGDKYAPVSLQSSLGLPPSPQQIQHYKTTFLELLERAVEEIYSESVAPTPDPSKESTKGSVGTSLLHELTKIMKVLPMETVEEIFSEVFKGSSSDNDKRKQSLLVDVSAASGASAPIRVLLEKMKNDKISSSRAGSLFMTLPNNLFAPSVIPDLMNYVKTLDIEQNPILTSSALLNFASLAERTCINERAFRYSIPYAVFGKEDCKPSMIVDDFLPYLSKKADSAEKSWQRAVFLQAISNLGTPKILPVLRPYVYGHLDISVNSRLIAIYGLTRRRLPDAARKTVFETLMPLVENREERPDVRQAALSALVTWHPDAAWWQRMARSTWRESSQSMAAFITFTIESLAKATEPRLQEQAEIAAFALPLLKPYSPSMKLSYNRIYSRFDPRSKIGVDFIASVIQSHDIGYAPTEIYSSLLQNFGDLYLSLFEVSVSFEDLSQTLDDLTTSLLLDLKRSDERPKPVNVRSSLLREEAEADTPDREEPFTLMREERRKDASVYVRGFNHLYQFVPINRDVISRIFGEGGEKLVKELIQGKNIAINKFSIPLDLEYYLPTEIGLPLVGSVVMPTMNVGEAYVKLVGVQAKNPTIYDLLKEKQINLQFKTDYKFMSKLTVKMSTPTPWSLRMVEAGVENYREVNAPVDGVLSLNRNQELINTTISFSSHAQQKFPVLHSHNVPFTQSRNLLQTKAKEESEYKVIGVEKSRQPVVKVEKRLSNNSGLEASLDYRGDAPYPFTTAYLIHYLRNPVLLGKLMTSPVSKQWQSSIVFDPHLSTTRNITLALSVLNFRRNESSGRSEDMPDFSAQDKEPERRNKLQSFSEGSPVHGVHAQVFLSGKEYRTYETIAAITRRPNPQQQRKRYKIVLASFTNDGPKALCLRSDFETPDVESFADLKEVIESGPNEALRSTLNYGSSCASTQIASLKGSLKLSTERQQLLEDEVEKICERDPLGQVAALQTAAVYDSGRFEVEFEEEKLPKWLLNATYRLRDTVDGLLFPFAAHDNMHSGTPQKIVLDAKRALSSDRYTLWIDMPHKRSIYTRVQVPYMATRLVPWTSLNNRVNKNSNLVVTSTLEAPSTCTVKEASIETYDGAHINFSPLHCWTELAFDKRRQNLYFIRIRQTEAAAKELQLQIRLLDKKVGSDADVRLTNDHALINGKAMAPDKSEQDVYDKYHRPVVQVKRVSASGGGGFTANLVGNFSIRVTKTIEITPAGSLQKVLMGMCGDFNGSPDKDKKGPKGCVYTDDNLYKFAWTDRNGKGCNIKNLNNEKKLVKDYQKNCPHASEGKSVEEMRSIYEKKLVNCYDHVFPVEKEGPGWCASNVPVQICSKECSSQGKRLVKEYAGCWPIKEVPDDVREAEKIGYMSHPAKEHPPFVGKVWYHEDTDCRQK